VGGGRKVDQGESVRLFIVGKKSTANLEDIGRTPIFIGGSSFEFEKRGSGFRRSGDNLAY